MGLHGVNKYSFLNAAERVLEASGKPMTPEEITASALQLGLFSSAGQTPSQTMKSKLSMDVLHGGMASRFMRSGPNQFALRRWKHVQEVVADRFQKALMDEDVIVFDRTILRDYFPIDGISSLAPDSGLELIAQTYPMKRSAAEEDCDVIQLVSQFLVVHHHKVAAHKRTRRLPEARLHGVHSLLFGGHLNPDDVTPLFGPFDPVNGARYITRELSEEVRISGGDPRLDLVGGIYDPRSPVSEQHLGVLYVVRIPDESTIQIGERGFLQQLRFLTLQEIGQQLEKFENWSELVFSSLLQNQSVTL